MAMTKIVGAESAGVAFVEYLELHAIEAHQSVERRHPQITIAGLCDRANGVLGQPVVSGPTVQMVLSCNGMNPDQDQWRQPCEGKEVCPLRNHMVILWGWAKFNIQALGHTLTLVGSMMR